MDQHLNGSSPSSVELNDSLPYNNNKSSANKMSAAATTNHLNNNNHNNNNNSTNANSISHSNGKNEITNGSKLEVN